MSFTLVAIATSIAALLLAIGWLFAGGAVLKQWGIELNAVGQLVGRRIGAVYLGIALLLFLGRSAPPSDLRSSICVGMFVSLAILAGLGLFELRSGRAGNGILVAAVSEIVLAAGWAWLLLT